MRKCNFCKEIQGDHICTRCKLWQEKASSKCCSCSKSFRQDAYHYAKYGNYCKECDVRLDEVTKLRSKKKATRNYLTDKDQVRLDDLTYRRHSDIDVDKLLTYLSLWNRTSCYNKPMDKTTFMATATDMKLEQEELMSVIDTLITNSDYTLVGQVLTNDFVLAKKQK